MADKKSGPTAADIMSGKDMKPYLSQSGEKTISAAIGLTEDKLGVILLDRKMKPRKVLSELKARAKKIKLALDTASLRFGTAKVDETVDSTLVTFTVNKGGTPGNLPMKLKEILKEANYEKVVILVDESLDREPEDDSESESEEVGTTTATVQPPPPPPTQPTADATALINLLKQLTLQIPKVADGDDAVQQALLKLATAAETALAGGNLQQAAADIEALRRAMGEALEAAKGKPATPENIAKSGQIWLGTRKKIEEDLDRLRAEIVASYQDADIAEELNTRYREKVAPLLTAWDTSLAVTLAKVAKETDATARATLIGEAKATMTRYAKVVASEKIIGDLDNNPFVPLSLQKTVAGTLAMLSKAVR